MNLYRGMVTNYRDRKVAVDPVHSGPVQTVTSTVLSVGDTGSRVRELQNLLISTGWWQAAYDQGKTTYDPAKGATGNFLAETEKVVNFFKDAVIPGGNKGTNRGKVGESTFEALKNPLNAWFSWAQRNIKPQELSGKASVNKFSTWMLDMAKDILGIFDFKESISAKLFEINYGGIRFKMVLEVEMHANNGGYIEHCITSNNWVFYLPPLILPDNDDNPDNNKQILVGAGIEDGRLGSSYIVAAGISALEVKASVDLTRSYLTIAASSTPSNQWFTIKVNVEFSLHHAVTLAVVAGGVLVAVSTQGIGLPAYMKTLATGALAALAPAIPYVTNMLQLSRA